MPQAKVALIFDWDSWWGLSGSVGPSVSLDYMTEVNRYYAELYRRHLAVDVVRKTDDLSDYAAVFAPCLYMVDAATEANLCSYVQGGGRLVMTTMSSITDEHDMCHLGGAPSPLRDVFGVWAEETDATGPQFSTPLFSRGQIPRSVRGRFCVTSCVLIPHVPSRPTAAMITMPGLPQSQRMSSVTGWDITSRPCLTRPH